MEPLSEIRKIESIQKTFTRNLCQKLNIKFRDYPDRIRILHMETLEKRRLKSDLILFYRIHNHQISIESENLQMLPNINLSYNLRRHD